MQTFDYKTAHKHSSHHRKEIFQSAECGCFSCLAVFGPQDIKNWTDAEGGEGQTALCPRCEVDAVIGTASGFPINMPFLEAMKSRWF